MKKNDAVRNLMTPNPTTIGINRPVSEARALLTTGGFHHLPVVNGTVLAGLLSASDILKIIPGGWGADDRSIDAVLDHQFSIAEIMTKDLTTVGEGKTVRHVVDILAEGNFHAVPIVADNGDLAGIVTSTDVIRYLKELY